MARLSVHGRVLGAGCSGSPSARGLLSFARDHRPDETKDVRCCRVLLDVVVFHGVTASAKPSHCWEDVWRGDVNYWPWQSANQDMNRHISSRSRGILPVALLHCLRHRPGELNHYLHGNELKYIEFRSIALISCCKSISGCYSLSLYHHISKLPNGVTTQMGRELSCAEDSP
jgi:hypothetical protein